MKEYQTAEMIIILRDNNIIELLSNEDWKGAGTLENAKEVMSTLKKITDENNVRVCLIEIPNRHVSKEILTYYQSFEVGFTAQAFLLNSFGAKVMGNLYLKLFGGKANTAGRVVPTKLFTKKAEAEKWLLEEIAKK
jgi:hypothetical protein